MALADVAPTALLVALLLVGTVVVTVAAARARRIYEALADDLAVHGFVSGKRPALLGSGVAGEFRGRVASVRHVKHGKGGPWTTRIAVSHSGPPAFTLRIDPVSARTEIARVLGGQDAILEDPPFDSAFRVRTSDRERAIFTLDAHARASLVGDPPWRLDVTRGRVAIDLKGRVTAVDRIGEGLAFATRLAERAEATA